MAAEFRPRIWFCLGLAATLALATFRDSVAGSPAVDLSSYLAGTPTVGDFKDYARDDGGSEVVTTESVTVSKNTVTATFSHTEDGKTSHQIEEQVARKLLLAGSEYDDTLDFSRPHPQRLYTYRFVPGRPQKLRLSATVLYQGVRVAKATTTGSTTFVGFEPITTALGTFDQAVHFSTQAVETIREKGHPDFVIVSSGDTWIAKPYGTVYFTRQSQSFVNGVVQSSFGPHQYTFDHGVLHGVAVP